MPWLEFFGQTPYSSPLILGLVFLILALMFAEVKRRTEDQYFFWLGLGMFLCAIAWGTTDLQNTGKLYVDWQWWWAQPIFSFGVVCLSIGIIEYLPLPAATRIILKRVSVVPPIIYLIVVTVLLWLEFKIIRAYAVWALIPSITVIAIASFQAEKVEPDKGHRLLGLLILCTPILTIAFPIFGLTTAVLRFWTAVPLIILSVTILAASLLRDRDVIKKSLDQLYAAETQLIALNKDLETRVEDRTALLNEIIADLESFNRNVSHDIRGPLGSIGLAAYLAQQQLNKGQLEQAKVQLQSISDQVNASQNLVNAMLNLATPVETKQRMVEVDLTSVVQERVDQARATLKRKHPEAPIPQFLVGNMGKLYSDPALLRIVLDNLIDNAIKFNLFNPKLRISIAQDTHLNEPCMYVYDNGIGFVNASDQRHFDPFERLTANGLSTGHGLGLSIVRRAVQRLGGKIWSKAAPENGAVFYFTLPQPQSGAL
jgi:signal transduction histidine kinase